MGSWPPCKQKPSGLQAATARTYVATLQELLGCDQCSDHGHLSDWICFAESEKDWNWPQNDCMSQTRKRCAQLGTGVLSPAVCSEWMVTTGPASFQIKPPVSHEPQQPQHVLMILMLHVRFTAVFQQALQKKGESHSLSIQISISISIGILSGQ